jgi:hypothetical protein
MLLPPDELDRAERWPSDAESPENDRPWWANKLWLLVSLLKDMGVFSDDIIWMIGQNDHNTRREQSYIGLYIPKLHCTILISNEYANKTFIIPWMKTLDWLCEHTKSQIEAVKWVIGVNYNYSDQNTWAWTMRTHISSFLKQWEWTISADDKTIQDARKMMESREGMKTHLLGTYWEEKLREVLASCSKWKAFIKANRSSDPALCGRRWLISKLSWDREKSQAWVYVHALFFDWVEAAEEVARLDTLIWETLKVYLLWKYWEEKLREVLASNVKWNAFLKANKSSDLVLCGREWLISKLGWDHKKSKTWAYVRMLWDRLH